MALKTFLVNGNQANYSDAEFSVIQTLMFGEGSFDNDGTVTDLKVLENAPTNLSVDVATGNMIMSYVKNGVNWNVVVNNGTVANLTLASNVSGANRLDAIVVHLKQTEPNSLKNNVAEFRVITGTGITALTEGDIDTELGDSNWYRLADVTIPDGATTIEQADISDTRSRISFLNRFKKIFLQEIYESIVDAGVDINNTRFIKNYVDFLERTTPLSLPSANRWFAYFKTDGLYIMDDLGNEVKVATGGTSVVRKSKAAAAQGELFESTETDTLSFKDAESSVINMGFGGVYGENITVGDPLSPYKVTDMGATQYSPSADTYINQTSPGTNYAGNTTLETYALAANVKQALFKFDNLIADLGVAATEIERIVSFRFRFYRNSAASSSTSNLCLITTAWNNATVTYTTKPTVYEAAPLFSTPFNSTTGYISFSVTNYISKAKSDYILANGFAITTNHNTGGAHVWTSFEGTNKPYIDSLVYIGVDGKLYKASGLHPESVRDFVGLASKTDIVDTHHAIHSEGMTVESSGLTPGATYYIDDTGALSQTPGTFMKEVGSARGTDKFQVRGGICYLGGEYNNSDGSSVKVPRGANMAVCSLVTPQSGGFNSKGQVTIYKKGATSGEVGSEVNSVSVQASATWDLANNEIDINISGGSGQGQLQVNFYQIT